MGEREGACAGDDAGTGKGSLCRNRWHRCHSRRSARRVWCLVLTLEVATVVVRVSPSLREEEEVASL